MLENLTCTQCGETYYGDPAEVRLCLDCDEEPDTRNVSVFMIDTVVDRDFSAFATLQQALEAASYYGLEDADFLIQEADAISHHVYMIHYRNDAHREAYRNAILNTPKREN